MVTPGCKSPSEPVPSFERSLAPAERGCPDGSVLGCGVAVGFDPVLSVEVLKVGDTCPEFVLPDARGRLVASQDLICGGPLVLDFFHGDWCGPCVARLEALDAVLSRLRGLGATLVAVTPESAAHARRTLRRLRLSLPVLCDLDHGLALSFGLLFRIPVETRAEWLDRHVDLGQRHGTDDWMLPLPATYVIRPTGLITAMSVNRRRNLTPYRRSILTPLLQSQAVAAARRSGSGLRSRAAAVG